MFVLLEICDLFEYLKIILNLLTYHFLFVFLYLLSICDDHVLHESTWHYWSLWVIF